MTTGTRSLGRWLSNIYDPRRSDAEARVPVPTTFNKRASY